MFVHGLTYYTNRIAGASLCSFPVSKSMPMEAWMTLGQRILEACKAQGMSQAELAERIGMSAQRLNHFIRDRRTPDPKTIVLMAQALNTTADYILGVSKEEVASLENILARVLQLEGIAKDRAHTIARIAVSAHKIALSSPVSDADQNLREHLAAHAAWMSHQHPSFDK